MGEPSTLEHVAFNPKEQHSYGSGGSGYGTDTLGRPIYSPLENESYGPKFDGSTRPLGNPLQNGDQLTAKYQYFKDRNKFWQTAMTNQYDLSLFFRRRTVFHVFLRPVPDHFRYHAMG